MIPRQTGPRASRGFALAMVLLLLAAMLTAYLLVGSGYVATKKLDVRAYDRTAFGQLDQALARFTMVNKRLPCPANGTASTGLEDVGASTTDCQSPSGPVPWRTLGLPISAATDGYGRLYGYRVYDGATGFTRTGAFALTDCLDEDDTSTTLSLSAGSCNAATHENVPSDFFAGKGLAVNDLGTVRNTVAYVLLTHGASGYGAYVPNSSTPLPAPTSGSKEAVNASDSATYWIVATNDTAVPPTHVDHFDDALSYIYAKDVAIAAGLSGRSWPLAARLNAVNLGMGASNNLGSSTGLASATTGRAMTITAAASTPRHICRVSGAPEGIAPCLTDAVSGNDRLSTSGDERLSFAFRVKRRYLMVKLTEFHRAGINIERAKFTFYNGATQVHEVVKSACGTGPNDTARYTLNPTTFFTRIEVRADDSSTSTEFGVSSISGCKVLASCWLRETDGIDCP